MQPTEGVDGRERLTPKAGLGGSSGQAVVSPVSTPRDVVRSEHPEKAITIVPAHLDGSGWVSISRRQCAGSTSMPSSSFEEGTEVVATPQVDQERVSLSTLDGMCCVRLNYRKAKSGQSKKKGRLGD